MEHRITINGRQYDSPDAMPPGVRRLYEDVLRQGGPLLADRDADGIPDGLQDAGPGLSVQSRIVVNGRAYASPGEMPADVRRLYDDAMRAARESPGAGGSVTGPGCDLNFGLRSARTGRDVHPVPGAPTPAAIEPGEAETRLRVLLVLAALLGLAIGAWALLGPR